MRPLFFCPATNSTNVDTDMSKGGEWLRRTAPTSDAAHRSDHARSWVLGHNNERTILPTAAELLILPLIVRIGNLRISKGFEYKEAADTTLSTDMHIIGPEVGNDTGHPWVSFR
jgi:hypothetical protein